MIVFEQILNGVQFGITLFLISAGLTLIFGIMGVINLSPWLALYDRRLCRRAGRRPHRLDLAGAVRRPGAWRRSSGIVIEMIVVRRLYDRDPLDQVLATFALILIINQGTVMLFGRQPLFVSMPPALSEFGHAAAGAGLPRLPAWRDRTWAAGCRWAVLLDQATRASACWCAPAPPTARWCGRWAFASAGSIP